MAWRNGEAWRRWRQWRESWRKSKAAAAGSRNEKRSASLIARHGGHRNESVIEMKAWRNGVSNINAAVRLMKASRKCHISQPERG
jgi:hypothetical protein